ncbi:hypothetical protein L1987_12225 [Smallanthus sonchifolius]|uniref:Uncharacterized protein n=1 Tax=Smallanthus sonchifolius TaxID=185202 RepID=A0ACB9JE12_9ASTR|nr:hypothetical protein L1987_12225 [Smallanthus sonchifolius]
MIPSPLQAIKGKVKNFHLQVQKDTRTGDLKCTVNKLTDPVIEEVTSATPLAAKITPSTPKPATPSATGSTTKRSLFQSLADCISETKRLRFLD